MLRTALTVGAAVVGGWLVKDRYDQGKGVVRKLEAEYRKMMGPRPRPPIVGFSTSPDGVPQMRLDPNVTLRATLKGS